MISFTFNPFTGNLDAISTVSIGSPANGLSITAGQVLSLGLSSTSTTGALSSTDWNTFNNKQPAGNYITDLTGDVVATGPGSAAATIQSNVVTYAKIQQVGASSLLGNPTGSTANVSQITLGSGLSFVGSTLTATGSGTVSSVALADGSSTPIYTISGSPVTGSGTLTFTLNTEPANTVFAGPTTGAAAQPTFRALVAADLPAISPSGITLTNTHILVGNASNVATDVAMSGDTTISNTGAVTIANNAVSNAKFRQSAAVSVVGNATNATANVADISSGAANNILRADGTNTTIGFGSIDISAAGAVGASILGIPNGGTNNSAFTQGSVVFAGAAGALLTEDNANFFWDNATKRLGIGSNAPTTTVYIAGDVYATKSVTDSPVDQLAFVTSSHTTVSGSNTTTGINGAATGIVDVGAVNDKDVSGAVYTVTRGDGTDDGNLSGLVGSQALIFLNSGAAGTTDKGYGSAVFTFLQQGTITDFYDFRSETIPAGTGVITNHYGIYVNPDPNVTIKNWLAGNTLLGGSSFSSPTVALDVQGDARIRNLTTGAIVADATGNLSSVAPGSSGNVLTSNGTTWVSSPSTATITFTATAGENLTADDAVYICNSVFDQVASVSRTVGNLYKLDVTNSYRYVYAGIVQATTTAGNPAIVQVVGDIGGWSGLPIGLPIYASITTPGSYQTSAPASTSLIQSLGITAGVDTDLLINGALGNAFQGTMPLHYLYTASTGYAIAGLNGSVVPVTSVDKINFSNDSISAGTAMPTVLRAGGSVSSSTRFYTMGGLTTGGTPTNNVDYYQYSNDTTGAAANTLTSTVDLDGGVYSTIAGYAAGDASGGGANVIYKLLFNGETTSTLGATLATTLNAISGCPTPTIGYFYGGTSGTGSTVAQKLLLTNETTANLASSLTTAIAFSAMYSSASRIYIAGGENTGANGTSQIQYMNISDETIGTLSATLTGSRATSGGCWSQLKGYNMGGYTSGTAFTDNVQALTFSGETSANLSAVLSIQRWEMYNAQH